MSDYKIYPITDTSWKEIDWGKVGQAVWSLQCKIYLCSKSGDFDRVQKLQQYLLGTSYARLYAVRTVTQDNKGKVTAGVDGVKRVNPSKRLKMACQLTLGNSCDPVRRTYLPKPGKTEMRPLGIPTMRDRARQSLALLALEPQYEAIFEPNSYGFRPGRSTQDAVQSLRNGLKNNPKYVFDADIKGCFDNLLHSFILSKLNTCPVIYDQISSWLEGKVIEPSGAIISPAKGTPQGGVLSPLLANISLDGLENELLNHYEYRMTLRGHSVLYNQGKATFVRYADDFIIAHSDLQFLQECITISEKFLAVRGLTISKEKSRILVTNKKHLCPNTDYTEGFDFLGFNFRVFDRKYGGTKNNRGVPKPFILYVTPSKKNLIKHYREIKQVVWKNKSKTQVDLIARLNPKIRGWAGYYQHVNSSKYFSDLDHKLWWLTFNWSLKRHSTKSKTWVLARYFHRFKNVKHKFLTLWNERPSRILTNYSDTHIDKYFKCTARYTPYEFPDEPIKDLFQRNTLSQKLYSKQKGICKVCGTLIVPRDKSEKHHLLPHGHSLRNSIKYIWLIHTACHDQVHADDSFSIIRDKSLILEE